MIERKIVIGLITSTDYIKQIRGSYDQQFLESATAKRLASWCLEYFDKYDKAPGKDIENIYYAKLNEGKLAKELFNEIEEEILPSLSKEYERTSFNVGYLTDQTNKYFQERRLQIYSENIQGLLRKGDLTQAERLACEYKPLLAGEVEVTDLNHGLILDKIERAFNVTNDFLIRYPKQLGEFWNSQFVRGGFVALMAPEKRGKTFWLLDIAIRGAKQGRNVVFFQAGDMTEAQQLKRICIYLTRKSDQKRYTGKMWEPVRDCKLNQLNECDKDEREGSDGPFAGTDRKEFYKLTQDDLIQAYKENRSYKPCCNCPQYAHKESKLGAPWIREVEVKGELTAAAAKAAVEKFFIEHQYRFKLSSHVNNTLSVKQIKALLAIWEKQDGFIPDVIVIDYADLLVADNKDFRHGQNEIWKDLRSLSQERHCLVVTATQADADSYDKDRLAMKNFSEDKRKFAHVTAMYGLNQDKTGKEKKIGLMRINEIVVREGDFSADSEVTVLQNLKRGRPFIGSYW
jgi:hypothetical protein